MILTLFSFFLLWIYLLISQLLSGNFSVMAFFVQTCLQQICLGYIFHLISSNCGDNSLPPRVKQNLFCTGTALPRSFYLDAIVPGPRCESNSSSSQRQALGGNEAFKFQNDLMESRKKTKIKIMASKVKHFLHLVNGRCPPPTLQWPRI